MRHSKDKIARNLSRACVLAQRIAKPGEPWPCRSDLQVPAGVAWSPLPDKFLPIRPFAGGNSPTLQRFLETVNALQMDRQSSFGNALERSAPVLT